MKTLLISILAVAFGAYAAYYAGYGQGYSDAVWKVSEALDKAGCK